MTVSAANTLLSRVCYRRGREEKKDHFNVSEANQHYTSYHRKTVLRDTLRDREKANEVAQLAKVFESNGNPTAFIK